MKRLRSLITTLFRRARRVEPMTRYTRRYGAGKAFLFNSVRETRHCSDRYQLNIVTQIQGRPVLPRYHVEGPFRSFRASSLADAEYLATALNNMTDEQQMTALEAATANRIWRPQNDGRHRKQHACLVAGGNDRP